MSVTATELWRMSASEQALDTAAAADQTLAAGTEIGPLHGVPMARRVSDLASRRPLTRRPPTALDMLIPELRERGR
jgi:hypothetical protein